MKKLLKYISCVFFTTLVNAQLPNTDIWSFRITDEDKKTILTEPLNITNREGYDNQPSFTADGKKIYYTSIRDDNQADIYQYDLKKKKIKKITGGIESEYSPVVAPDGLFITSVVVEEDSSQRIHFINPETGVHEKKLEPDSIGYYAFLNADSVVYYKLTDPHSLWLFSASTGQKKWIGNSPARTFRTINRYTLLYGLKDSVSLSIYKYNFLLRKAEIVTICPAASEDMIWHSKWGIIRSEENKLLRFDEQKKEWVLLFDLSAFGIKKITRFAIDPRNKHLVIVNNK